MVRRKPTQQEIDAVIETYHDLPYKDICLELLKEASRRTGLGLAECKGILVKYIEETYGK